MHSHVPVGFGRPRGNTACRLTLEINQNYKLMRRSLIREVVGVKALVVGYRKGWSSDAVLERDANTLASGQVVRKDTTHSTRQRKAGRDRRTMTAAGIVDVTPFTILCTARKRSWASSGRVSSSRGEASRIPADISCSKTVALLVDVTPVPVALLVMDDRLPPLEAVLRGAGVC